METTRMDTQPGLGLYGRSPSGNVWPAVTVTTLATAGVLSAPMMVMLFSIVSLVSGKLLSDRHTYNIIVIYFVENIFELREPL